MGEDLSRVREKIPLLVMQPMNSNLLFRMETCIMSEEKNKRLRSRHLFFTSH